MSTTTRRQAGFSLLWTRTLLPLLGLRGAHFTRAVSELALAGARNEK